MGVAVAVTLLYNNKYLALFNMNGGLISFTHRSYGSYFLNLSPNDSIDAVQPWIVYTKSNTDESAAQQAYVADTKTMKISSPTLTNGALVFKYTESRYPELQATAFAVEWRLQSRDEVGKNAGLRGRLIVDGAPPSGREFQRAEFPVLRGLVYDKGTQVMVPQHSGGRVYSGWGEGATPTSYGSGLLTSAWSLPLVVIKKGNYSLMWAAEDSNNFPKAFAIGDFWKEGGTGPIHANDGRFHHYHVGGLGKGPNYDVVLTPMYGDWIRPTKKYRNWATTQAWTKSGTAALTVANRTAVSTTLRDGLFWWLTFLDPSDANAPTSFQSYAKNLKKSNIGPAQNVNVGFHLFQCYKNRFDVLLPEFDPKHSVGQDPVTQWRTVIGVAQKDGSIVTPYISATLIDISDATSNEVTNRPVPPAACNLVSDGWWTRDYQGVALRDFVMKRGPTSVFTGCFNSGRLLAFMDPSATAWQHINQSNVNKVFELDSGGIYLDSFPAVFRRDYSGRHSDSAGSWWLDGTLAIAAQTVATASDHEAIRPVFGSSRRMTSSEFFMEPAMPFIDVVMN